MKPTPDDVIQPEDEVNTDELGEEIELEEAEETLDELTDQIEDADVLLADEPDLAELEEIEEESEEEDSAIDLTADLGDDPVRPVIWSKCANSCGRRMSTSGHRTSTN